MGFDANGVRFLLEAKKSGVLFDDCAMLGRQNMNLSKAELKYTLAAAGHPCDSSQLTRILPIEGSTYAENFLEYCGAAKITSFDNSNYENASVVHDMNLPIPAKYYGQYSCLIDGGTLEHVFNYPVALLNCMQMTRVNGHILFITPCNNYCGHGFYQFSPELFYGVFSENNGFSIDKMFVCEVRSFSPWYSVTRPSSLGKRVMLENSRSTYLLVQAKKISELQGKGISIQQSDYVEAWGQSLKSRTENKINAKIRSIATSICGTRLTYRIVDMLRRSRKRLKGRYPAPFYKRYP